MSKNTKSIFSFLHISIASAPELHNLITSISEYSASLTSKPLRANGSSSTINVFIFIISSQPSQTVLAD